MKNRKKSYRTGGPPGQPPSRPSLVTLLSRIAEYALTGGVRWLVLFGGLLVAFLYVNHMPADTLVVMMIFAILTSAIFRGIRAWQDDLDEYRRSLTEYRMNLADSRNKLQPKKDIVWDRH